MPTRSRSVEKSGCKAHFPSICSSYQKTRLAEGVSQKTSHWRFDSLSSSRSLAASLHGKNRPGKRRIVQNGAGLPRSSQYADIWADIREPGRICCRTNRPVGLAITRFATMYYFCTYFDHKFLPRGLALHESLTDHCPSFRLWVLCLDPLAHDALCQLNLPNLCPIALKDFENEDEELLSAKRNRSRIEYYFTCTPSLPLYVFNHNPEVDLITYLDADLYFFGDPKPIFEEMTNKSVAITEHRFPDHRREIMEVYGLYNVGWLSFRRDGTALDCLHWWRERCLEWCHDHPAEGRFADQKYLDEWPSRFQRVVVIRQKGVNVAPWNMANYQFRQ